MKSYIYALGFFDGVHAGHQALLRECLWLAHEHGAVPGVVTFGSHPDTLVFGQTPALINTPSDRERLLCAFGMERIVTLPFNREMCATHWRDFLAMLERDYGAVGFVCGEDFRFGSKGMGTAPLMADYCGEKRIPCSVVPEQLVRGIRVSSTHIRTLIEQGETELAAEFLGHPHMLTGPVVAGKQLGRTLGIPTANLRFPDGLVVPKFGVYACLARVGDGVHPAVTNVGTRPTVNGSGITIEPWILDFSGDLYGRTLTLEFYRFLRPERRFESLEALQAEIRRNAEQTREYLNKYSYSQPCFIGQNRL